jgi:hypothetical protein
MGIVVEAGAPGAILIRHCLRLGKKHDYFLPKKEERKKITFCPVELCSVKFLNNQTYERFLLSPTINTSAFQSGLYSNA